LIKCIVVFLCCRKNKSDEDFMRNNVEMGNKEKNKVNLAELDEFDIVPTTDREI